jgi:hypothetical protein
MPRIPTFTAKQDMTTDVGGQMSNIQISPTQTIAGALLPAVKQTQAYLLKKRDNEEKLEAKKTLLELKTESDKLVLSQKNNPNEQESINNWKSKFDGISQNKISGIKNPRIKKLVQDGLELENLESIYNLKTNSFKAFEEESIKTYNNEVTMLSAKYKTTNNPILKAKYKDELYRLADGFNNTHELGDFDKKERRRKIDATLLLADADFTIGLGFDNAEEQIAKLDGSQNGANFINDEDFANGIYNSYAQKINDLTVKGDPNADYELAEDLLDQLETFKRYNGSEVLSGDRKTKFSTLKQRVLNEKISHNKLVKDISMGEQFEEYSKGQKSILESKFYNALDSSFNKTKNKALAEEAGFEYDERISSNPDASLFERQQYAKQLNFDLQDKYAEVSIEQITAFNLQENKFNVTREAASIIEARQMYVKNPKEKNILKTLARLNGYVDEKGNPQVNKFYNDYIKILNQRKEG